MSAKFYNVTPKPAMLRAIQNERWTALAALAELIDNSFGPGRGNATQVVIEYSPKARVLTLSDDGQGMVAIGKLFRHGDSIGRTIGDIGEYGAGGTKALLWLASVVKIWTLRDGKVQSDRITWRKWIEAKSFRTLNVSNEWRDMPSNAPKKLLDWGHGTIIELSLLKTRKINQANLIRDLSKMYSTGIRRGGKKLTWITDGDPPRELVDPYHEPPATAKRVDLDFAIEYEDRSLPVKGQVFFDKNTTHADSRVQIGYAYRILRSTIDCFQSEDGSERYIGTGVSGWLDLGDGWRHYLTLDKHEFDDAPLWDTLMGRVFELIKPLLKEAERKSFSLEFDDLALGLEGALNLQTGSVTIQTGDRPGDSGRGDGGGGSESEPGPEPGGKPDGEAGDKEKKVPPIFGVVIVPTSDLQMKGELCRAEINREDIYVLVNAEHAVIKETMKSHPINRMALNLLLTTEIAGAISALDESDRVIKRLFKGRLAIEISSIELPRDRARTITRQLIDRVRSPMPEINGIEFNPTQ
jgi:hypothetical protein